MDQIGEKFKTDTGNCHKHGTFTTLVVGDEFPSCPTCKGQMAYEKLMAARQEEFEKRRVEQLAKAADEAVPLRYRAASLDDFSPKATTPVLAWFEACQRVPGGLILAGPVGTGKTHLACALTRKIVSAGIACKYTSQANYLRAIRKTWDGHGDEFSVMEEFIRPRVLVLDDIGAARGNENDVLRLGELISDRYDALKPTVFVTNLKPDDLKVAVGDRSYDRMRDQAAMVVLNGDSRRKPA